MTKTKKLALAAMLAALATVLLYLSSILPNGGLAFAALAALCTSIVYLECGLAFSYGHYVVTGVLGLLLVPEKTYVIWYMIVFGLYAMAKPLLEKLPRKPGQWIFKIILATAMLMIVLRTLQLFLAVTLPLQGPVLWAVMLAVFIIYDIGVSGALKMYRYRIRRGVK